MFARLGVVVAASVAAFAVKQLNGPKPTTSVKDPENDDESIAQHENEEQEDKQRTDAEHVAEEKEEEEEVKRISSINSSSLINPALLNDEESILPEFEEFPSSKVEFPLPRDKFDVKTSPEASKDNSAFETETASHSSEIERLQNLVKELQDRELKLGGELLGYYGAKEQESDIEELERQLKIKTVEINMLNVTISSLQEERKKLHDEISRSATLKRELETARNKIKELQRQIQLDANQTKGQLLMLKQQVSSLQLKEEEAAKKDAEVEKKLKSVKELEVQLVELRRSCKELQHEKRQLTVKLEAAEAKITALSSMTESEMADNSRKEENNLRHLNEDLVKQVEGLQMNRFSEVEELVYLRWVNACLRYELRNYQAPPGKISARDLSKSLSLRSQEKAKQLMLEYAGSERGQGDTDNDSFSSRPSSPGSEDNENASNDSFSSRHSSMSRKLGLIQKLKRWGRSRDDSLTSSPTRSIGGSPRSPNIGRRFAMTRNPLEALILRNAGDDMAITTFGKKEPDTTESLNNVAESFQVMSRSVEGALDEKYPAYKDRHKLALEREKSIKERADQARAQKFGDILNLKPKSETTPAQIKEKVAISGLSASNSSESLNDNKGDPATVSKIKLAQIEKRAPRVPRPPPKPSGGETSASDKTTIPSSSIPPPPPPPSGALPAPPPPSESLIKGSGNGDKVHRAPELVELYQSLMKREAKKDTNSIISAISITADVKSNMIGEIENRSAFLLAVKADVETQGDFVQSLATEVRAASFTNIEDVVSFVNWLDEELSFLVDERAVLKHFDWPEGKADALREAAFEYQDLVKLEKRVSSFVDDPKLPCESALRKMYLLLEKMEQSVYALLRTRDMAISRYKEFGIPVDWLLDSSVVGKIKLSSVQLARKYMTRVQSELDALSGSDKEPNREFLLLQGVRFAFRVHQFAGGFDAESMQAFEELRSRAHATETGEAEKPET